ncbi:hypothetical protein [Lactiplantibacillus plantarum]|uniref:hypothetical protein n=1 Tax=Lactiplantibacillus plantarum TaxID=1590 RepID=UPI00217DFF44|nr:hypothetical protein [Lactiplantibacillus plantarum]UWF30280.1 hypothetical protein NYR27_09560 [Lactiplantibacillus plantarum]UWF40280.1 hypothetical protein NYR28_05945 [Lactiplantibacillus plantarum]UWF43279.1 hypothetical protein NYR31_05955 [Lactiplantibacillus plantarum]
MKKIVLLAGIVFSSTILAGCSGKSPNSSDTQTTNSSIVKNNYKYYAKDKTFYSPKGSLAINKLIGYTKDSNNYFILDVTYKNASKKQQDATSIMSPNIEAYQLNKDKSQKVHLDGSNSASDYFNTDDINNYNKMNEIIDGHSNKILPGKTAHTLMEFSYKLNNSTNNITFSLSDPNATSNETVNPKKNQITFNAHSISYNSLNTNDYNN